MRKVFIIFALFGYNAFAQVRSPGQAFRADIYHRYSRQIKEEDIVRFLEMPIDMVQLQRVERILKGDSIRMAALFGNYSGVLSLGDDELQRVGPQMIRLLEGDFRDFWHSEQFKQRTKDILFENPKVLVRVLNILEQINKSPESGRCKALLAKYPDCLVFLYHLPSLVNIPEDRLPVILHFLQNIDFTSTEKDKQEYLKSLDCFLGKWYRHLLPLYVANLDKYGPTAAFTMWAAPEFFNNCRDQVLQDDLKKNQKVWLILIGQMGFILEKRRESLDWPNDVKAISALLNRTPSSTVLNEQDWYDFLLRTNQANGEALRLLWGIRGDKEKLRKVDEFLAFLKGRDIPFSVILSLMKCSKNNQDFLSLIDLSMNPLYGINAEDGKKQSTVRMPVPIFIMSELNKDTEFKFINMYYRHKNQLIAYLNDINRGKSVQERFNLAVQTDLADAKYDESHLKQLSSYLPGGSIINVVIKSYNGFPVTGLEYTMAAIDVARFAAMVATAGGSEAIGTAGGEVTKKTAEEAAKKTIGEVAKATSEKAVWKSFVSLAGEAAKKGIKMLTEEATERMLKTGFEYYRNIQEEKELARVEREMFSKESNLVTADSILAGGLYKRFSCLPIYTPVNRSRPFQRENMESVYFQLPNTNREWLETLAGRTDANSILLVTIADICELPQ